VHVYVCVCVFVCVCVCVCDVCHLTQGSPFFKGFKGERVHGKSLPQGPILANLLIFFYNPTNLIHHACSQGCCPWVSAPANQWFEAQHASCVCLSCQPPSLRSSPELLIRVLQLHRTAAAALRRPAAMKSNSRMVRPCMQGSNSLGSGLL